MLHLLGRLADSEAAYRNGLAVDHNNLGVLVDLCLVVAAQKRFDEALEIGDRVLARAPKSALAHLRKGMIYEQAGRPAEALRCVQTALKFDPNLADAQAALARLRAPAR